VSSSIKSRCVYKRNRLLEDRISDSEYHRVIQLQKLCHDKFGGVLEERGFAAHITLGKISGCNDKTCPKLEDLRILAPVNNICVPVNEFARSGLIYLAPR